MKRLLSLLLVCAVALVAAGCKTPNLETGGAYAQPGQKQDFAFYAVEGSFSIAHASLDAVFKFERDNREMLWKLNPGIKRTLDKIRPEAVQVVRAYGIARQAYQDRPIAENLSGLMLILARVEQLAATARQTIHAVSID